VCRRHWQAKEWDSVETERLHSRRPPFRVVTLFIAGCMLSLHQRMVHVILPSTVPFSELRRSHIVLEGNQESQCRCRTTVASGQKVRHLWWCWRMQFSHHTHTHTKLLMLGWGEMVVRFIQCDHGQVGMLVDRSHKSMLLACSEGASASWQEKARFSSERCLNFGSMRAKTSNSQLFSA